MSYDHALRAVKTPREENSFFSASLVKHKLVAQGLCTRSIRSLLENCIPNQSGREMPGENPRAVKNDCLPKKPGAKATTKMFPVIKKKGGGPFGS